MEFFNHDTPSHLSRLHLGKVGSWEHDWGCDLLGSSLSDLSKVISCGGEGTNTHLSLRGLYHLCWCSESFEHIHIMYM